MNMNMADEDNVLCGYIFLIPFKLSFVGGANQK
jgi:hypothetical protein